MRIDEINQFLVVDPKNGDTKVSLCVELAIFLKTSVLKAASEQLATLYQQVVDRWGGRFQWYLTDTMTKWRKASAKTLDIVPYWCKDPNEKKKPISIKFHSGKDGADYHLPVLDIGHHNLGYKDSDGYIQVCIPAEEFSAEDWIDFVKEALQNFPFRSGYAGYSLGWNDRSVEMSEQAPKIVSPWMERFEGLGCPAADICDLQMPPTNWLSLLGEELSVHLGGISRVKSRIRSEEIEVFSLGKGLCIRAGNEPQLGDVEQGESLPLYHEVGRAIKGVRDPQFARITGLSIEESPAWLARFDE